MTTIEMRALEWKVPQQWQWHWKIKIWFLNFHSIEMSHLSVPRENLLILRAEIWSFSLLSISDMDAETEGLPPLPSESTAQNTPAIDWKARRKILKSQPSTVATRRQQAVCVRRAHKIYGTKKNPNVILDGLNMTVPKGTM